MRLKVLCIAGERIALPNVALGGLHLTSTAFVSLPQV